MGLRGKASARDKKANIKQRRREVGASQAKTTLADRLGAWVKHHRRVAHESLQRLLAAPGSSLLTWLVIGIALALPAGLLVALNNMQTLAGSWDGAARISLFLHESASEAQGYALAKEINLLAGVKDTDYISRQAALEEFQQLSGFGEVLASLPENPLPAVVVVHPAASHASPDAVEGLLATLRAEPLVELAQLDMQWVQRLYTLMELGRRATLALATLLGLGVLLVTGNTIRLAIEGRRDEILIVKLVGGTNAYVRRPFLYTGLWYGLGGSLFAWVVVGALLWWLQGPVGQLAQLYESRFALQGLGLGDSVLLAASGGLLGLGGAWLAVSRHLGAIEPR